jgi:hypothetical protein
VWQPVPVNGCATAAPPLDVVELDALEFAVAAFEPVAAAFEPAVKAVEVLEPDAVPAAAVPADVATNEPLTTIAAISAVNRPPGRRRASPPLIPLRIARPFNTWSTALPPTACGGRQNHCIRQGTWTTWRGPRA